MYKIMLVDNDVTTLAIGKALLERKYKLFTARSGVQAMGSLKSGNLPDVCLLDMSMPGMTGIEVLKAMKEDPELEDIPVIFLASKRSDVNEKEGYLAGAVDFLQKPFEPDILELKLQQHLQLREMKKENKRMKQILKEIREKVSECHI